MDDLVPWGNADVQWVYELICDPPAPPNTEEHWEGYLARTIVTRFAARIAKLEAERDHAWNMVAKADADVIAAIRLAETAEAHADRLAAMLVEAGEWLVIAVADDAFTSAEKDRVDALLARLEAREVSHDKGDGQ
jgi:hypothetical protein